MSTIAIEYSVEAIAVSDRVFDTLLPYATITPEAGSKVVATFKSGQPAIVKHVSGKGKTTYITPLPGVAYLWSVYHPRRCPHAARVVTCRA